LIASGEFLKAVVGRRLSQEEAKSAVCPRLNGELRAVAL
jgi:hypothetical protein